MKNDLLKFFATGAFISYIPTAILKNKKNTGAGFLGTLEAFLLVLFIMPDNCAVFAIAAVLFAAFAVYVSEKVNFGDGKKDNPKIIIDEIAGYFFAVAFLPKTLPALLVSFVLFRLFDSVKISFIKKLENVKIGAGGFAVVADDVAAGIAANLITHILIKFI
jgi:phosphatidylglycerophosphatase A